MAGVRGYFSANEGGSVKAKYMPSVRARDFARKARERLRALYRGQGEIEPGQCEAEAVRAYMAGYRHGRKMKEKV